MAAISLEQSIISIIQNGDIEGFKKIGFCVFYVDKPFSFSNGIKIVSKSQKCPFKIIKSPNVVVLSILCEQEEILKYVLEKFTPNLSTQINGWQPIHFAASTGDYHCLQALLQYETIQNNVDAPISPFNKNVDPSKRTTALHIAVSNHCHAQAILLLSEFPDIIYDLEGKKYETPKHSEYQVANVSQQSENGNTPLHIAAKLNDIDMINILLFYGADHEIKDNNGKTPLDIAKENNYTEAVSAIENGSGNDLHSKYIQTPVVEDKKDDKKETEKKVEEVKTKVEYVTKGEVQHLSMTIQNLTSIVQQISSRVKQLESVEKPPDVHACVSCGIITGNKCSKCGEYCCETCISNQYHKCE